MKDYYKVLEVEPSSPLEKIKSQHRFLLHAWHPDKFPEGELRDKAEVKIREINEAFGILSDTNKRKKYDDEIKQNINPQQKYSQTINNDTCESCGLPNETKYVEFYENVGMIFIRQSRNAKGRFCKACIDYYFWNFTGKTILLGWWGAISLIVTPFILLNNFFRYIFTLGMKKPILRITPNPSPFWIFTTIGSIIFLGMFVFTIFASALTGYESYSAVPASTPKPTQRQTIKTSTPKPQITYNDQPCLKWSNVTPRYIDTEICIYGKIYNYGPYQNSWNTIEFSSSPNSFRMIDYNYDWQSPINIGDCVLIFGRIRDYGPYLFITPDIDAPDSIQRFNSPAACN